MTAKPSTPAKPSMIVGAAAALRDGSVTSVELTERCLAIVDALDDTVGAFIKVTAMQALEDAAKADASFAAGVDLGPLQGIPFALKDILATSDSPTTANSRVLDPAWGDGYDAVTRTRQAAAMHSTDRGAIR